MTGARSSKACIPSAPSASASVCTKRGSGRRSRRERPVVKKERLIEGGEKGIDELVAGNKGRTTVAFVRGGGGKRDLSSGLDRSGGVAVPGGGRGGRRGDPVRDEHDDAAAVGRRAH